MSTTLWYPQGKVCLGMALVWPWYGLSMALVWPWYGLGVGTQRVGLRTKSDHQERGWCDGQTDGQVSRVPAIVRNGRGPGVCNCV